MGLNAISNAIHKQWRLTHTNRPQRWLACSMQAYLGAGGKFGACMLSTG